MSDSSMCISLRSPPVFVNGSELVDGSYRFVIDARALNEQVIQDHYKLLKMQITFIRLKETDILSLLDLVNSFTYDGLKKTQ